MIFFISSLFTHICICLQHYFRDLLSLKMFNYLQIDQMYDFLQINI